MTRKHRVLTAAIAAVAVLGVTGCGEGDDGGKSGGKSGSGSAAKEKNGQGSGQGDTGSSSADRRTPSGVEKLAPGDILAKSAKANTSARTVRVSVPGSVDLTVDKAGNCAGTFTNEGFTNHLIRKGDKVWLKPEDAYWNDPATKAILAKFPDAKGKYMHGTTDKSIALMIASGYCEVGGPKSSAMFSGEGAVLTKGAVTTVEGTKVVPVHMDSKKDGKSTVYVATEGPPYAVKAESGKPKMTLFLSDFGKPFTVPPSPPASDTIDAVKIEELSMNTG
ncbi:hypothetical protein ACFRKB_09800 [Streptomyces scopuliridis]|uniref:hypothetical protein n=1 Tax=Streptomyces scopuliridis TaxID=452529 RepID=UPI00367D7470